MLSSLPRLADRAFVLGTFLPTLIFSVVLLWLFDDQEPVKAWINAIAGRELGDAAYLLLAAWAIAVMVLMVNLPLYRFLEGYTFPGWLAEWLKGRHRQRLQTHLREIEELYSGWAAQGSAFAELDRYRTLRRERLMWMPSREADILPTRFGNAIKAFEVYPRDIYGADGIVIWLRLVSVLPKAFGEQIQDMRSQIDFLVNCCFFSAIVGVLGFLRAIYSGDWRGMDLHTVAGVHAFISSFEIYWLLWTVGGAIASLFFTDGR
jgi:hypothetical protein